MFTWFPGTQTNGHDGLRRRRVAKMAEMWGALRDSFEQQNAQKLHDELSDLSDRDHYGVMGELHEIIHSRYGTSPEGDVMCRFLCTQLRRNGLFVLLSQYTNVFTSTSQDYALVLCFVGQELERDRYVEILRNTKKEKEDRRRHWTQDVWVNIAWKGLKDNYKLSSDVLGALFLNGDVRIIEFLLSAPHCLGGDFRSIVLEHDDGVVQCVDSIVSRFFPSDLTYLVISYLIFLGCRSPKVKAEKLPQESRRSRENKSWNCCIQ